MLQDGLLYKMCACTKKVAPPLYTNSLICPPRQTLDRLDDVAKRQIFLNSWTGRWSGEKIFYIIDVSEFEAYA